eukprot:CAMPEP_0114127028 /NCGR_PEP_ID=MMETSP0043_2-20121206/10148_1 /TAXON_ID=464988 /ORGANISM="Hemiselmis andersenii, Strain CCMP644" /LENGTH=50 /DNA_ID=CAMNT_0001220059 /DNA_START=7 /DNA_END=155 /DNA_ORIENTATION=-
MSPFAVTMYWPVLVDPPDRRARSMTWTAGSLVLTWTASSLVSGSRPCHDA